MWSPPWKLAALVACGAIGLHCAGGEARDTGQANTVRAYLSAWPASLSLIGKSDQNTEIVAVQITDSLVQYEPGLELQPRLAESWEFSDDRLTLTFRLRRGVRWHDGEPLTADDVVYTVEMAREPLIDNRTFGAHFAAERVTVEALDDHTVVARYTEAAHDDLDTLENWRLPILPRHVAERDGTPADPVGLLNGEFSQHPIGCGPFRYVRHLPDQEIVLEANDDYWDGRPAIDRLVLKVFPDQRTAYQALISGGLDVMHLTADLWNEAQRSTAAERLDGFIYYRLNVWQLSWNQDGSNPFFDDARVRQAMVLALDREQFNRTVIHGLARPGATAYHPDSPWTDRGIEPRPYDVERAARLLDEAGWSDSDGDGIRDRDGRPFAFTMMIPASTQKVVDHMAAWQQQSWSELGIRTEIEKLEWQAFREKRNARQFQAAAFALSFTSSPDTYDLFHSSAREGGFNFAGLADAEVDRLLEEGRRTRGRGARLAIYHALQRRIAELEPITCLFHFPTPVLHDRRLVGVTASPIDYWRTTSGPRNWRWTGSLRR